MSFALGIAKSTALYIFLALLVAVWWLGVELDEVRSAASNPSGFSGWFLFFGFWALPALAVTVALSTVSLLVKRRFDTRYRSVGVVDNLVGGLGYAFVNPFDGLRAPLMNKRVNDLTGPARRASKAVSYFHFSWAVALIAYLAFGLMAVS